MGQKRSYISKIRTQDIDHCQMLFKNAINKKVVITYKKTKRGPAKKQDIKDNGNGLSDFSYLLDQNNEESIVGNIIGAYPRFISIQYSDNSNNIQTTTVMYQEILSKSCKIKDLDLETDQGNEEIGY